MIARMATAGLVTGHGSVTAGLVVTRVVIIGQSGDHKTSDYRTSGHKKGDYRTEW